MKILTPNVQLNSKQNIPNQNKSQVSFQSGAAFAAFLRFLETNQAIGATGVDVTCMGAPRSAVDFTRGPAAGFETMRREFSSTADDALIGTYGFVAATGLAYAFNKRYGVKAHNMFLDDETLNIHSHTFNENRKTLRPLRNYVDSTLKNLRVFNPEHPKCDKNGYVGLDRKTIKMARNRFMQEVTKGTSGSIGKDPLQYLISIIATNTGGENTVKIEKKIGKTTQKSVSSLKDFLNDFYKISKTFVNSKVAETFKGGKVAENVYLKGLKSINKQASIIGLAIATGIGVSLQPINMYLTRKKTGQTGFVGVEGREPDKSVWFKVLKTAIAGVAGYGIISTIGKLPEVLKAVQFKGFLPTIPQYKLVYGMTIVSRLLSARDKNELRESTIKDSLGFVNWLILGGFVSKLAAAGFEKMAKFKNNDEKFIRYNKLEHGESRFNWLTKSKLVTRDEVLFEAFKKLKMSTIKADGKAMSFKEMFKTISELAPKSKIAMEARTKMRYIGFIQLAGYLYSGLVLGLGIPKLNIAITKSIEAKRKAKAQNPTSTVASANTTFLASQQKTFTDFVK